MLPQIKNDSVLCFELLIQDALLISDTLREKRGMMSESDFLGEEVQGKPSWPAPVTCCSQDWFLLD